MSANSAAEAIWDDITCRSGIGDEACALPTELRTEILDVWAEIIAKEAHDAFRYFQMATE